MSDPRFTGRIGTMRIGIDLGGTKIEGIVLDESGKTLARRRLPSPQGNYRATLEAIADLILGLEQQTGARGSVGIGIPGALSPATGRIKNANSTWIIGEALDRDLEQRLGRPIRLENDANCFALSEAVDGAGAGAGSLFGVILGTGVGGGLVVDGRLIGGRNAVTGEWGHNPLPWPDEAERQGPRCYCGKQGCIEVFLFIYFTVLIIFYVLISKFSNFSSISFHYNRINLKSLLLDMPFG